MESLANYDSDEEIDAPPSSSVKSKDSANCGMEGDNYDDVQMEMSENPLNGSKAPSVQAHSLGWPGEAPPTNAILESGSESVNKDDDSHCSPSKSHDSGSSSSPTSAATSNDGESEEEEDENPKPEETKLELTPFTTEKLEKEKSTDATNKEKDQIKRDLENRHDREKERERDHDKDRERDRGRDRDNKDRRKDSRREDRHRSRSRDRGDRHKSPERSERRRSRDRDERRKSMEKRSSSRERRRKESDRRYAESHRRDSDRKRHRSRSRSGDRHRPGNDSRSSSSSRSSKSEARPKDLKTQFPGPSRGSRSRSKSTERERVRAAGSDSRKFYMEKKIDRKLNVLERMGIELKAEAKTSAGSVTPQMLVQRTMEQEAAQVKLATGVELPSYYNAAAVNPQRLVDQIQKRKLLWGKKDDTAKTVTQQQPLNKWQGATFAQDQDGKLTAKFNRLMGIKQPAPAPSQPGKESGSEIIKKQEEMFHNMESQYEVARLATHTHRGLGLGFGTFQPR